MEIYNWWKKDRYLEEKEYDNKLTEWSDAHHNFADNAKDLHEELRAIEERNANKLDEMLIKIIKIRGRLWT